MDKSHSSSVGLRRHLGIVGLTLYGVGVTVGAGIYVLISKVARLAGAQAPLAFLVAALVAGMSFAELSVWFPRSAAEAIYVREGFGSAGLTLIMGFMIAIAGLISAGAVVVGSSSYIASLISLPLWIIILLLSLLLARLAIWGIVKSVAIIGFVTLVKIAEEVREPKRTMPRAILAILLITTVLYVALAWVFIAVTGVEDLAASDVTLGLVFKRVTGWSSAPFAVVAVFATINGALILIIMRSRVLYGLASQHSLPRALGHVWSVTGTPVPATLTAARLVLICALAMPISLLA